MLHLLILQERTVCIHLVFADCDVIQTVDFLDCIVQKIVNDGLSKILVGTLPYGTVWVNEPGPFVVSEVAK